MALSRPLNTIEKGVLMSMSLRVLSTAALLLIALLMAQNVLVATAQSDLWPNSQMVSTGGTSRPAFTCAEVSELPPTECAALVALYEATGGAQWNAGDGWLSTNTPCNWHGISCADGHVTAIRLDDNGLTGQLPATLAALSELRTLSLSHNALNGGLPPELGNLANLEELNLADNQLSGSIPVTLGNLANLRRLILWDNSLSDSQQGWAIPPELGNLASLQEIALSGNQLSGSIPPELGSLASLEVLSLGGNTITGTIPAQLGNLHSLQRLILSDNQLEGTIPPELGNLANLRQLWLSNNQLEGQIPAELGNLRRLRLMDLRNNHLSGPIPTELASLTQILELILSGNRLDGNIPAALSTLPNIQFLSLDSNQLGGVIPDALCGLPAFTWLGLDYNRFRDGPACIDLLAPFWTRTQTVPPADIQVTAVATASLEIHWTPIEYQDDAGGYEVSYATSAAGPWTPHGMTSDKRASSYVLTKLTPATTYYIRLRTLTRAHNIAPAFQQSDLWSDYSSAVTASTLELPGTPRLHLPLVLIRNPGLAARRPSR